MIIITGTPRSGTQYISKLLTSIGVPIGHEQYFGLPLGGIHRNNPQGDSSWLAVPYLCEHKARIIHIVREPVKVISSMMGRDFFNRVSLYDEFINFYLPIPKDYSLLDKCIYFYVNWNTEIQKYTGSNFYKVEDIHKNPQKWLLNISFDKKDKVIYNKNKANGSDTEYLKLKDFKKCELYKDLKLITKEYGY